MNYATNNANEAIFVHNAVDRILKALSRNSSIMSCIDANYLIRFSSLRFTRTGLAFINYETKRIGRSISDNFTKLARELKDSLKKYHLKKSEVHLCFTQNVEA
ncbi:MAG: hypothetical protein EXX96DRAFT_539210 [Benjaminiella poitrasii]|nr:MAG: hypothetical protein EXX96DRAFT_539210 [Benjaminiella poitrasii]